MLLSKYSDMMYDKLLLTTPVTIIKHSKLKYFFNFNDTNKLIMLKIEVINIINLFLVVRNLSLENITNINRRTSMSIS